MKPVLIGGCEHTLTRAPWRSAPVHLDGPCLGVWGRSRRVLTPRPIQSWSVGVDHHGEPLRVDEGGGLLTTGARFASTSFDALQKKLLGD